MPDLRPDNPHDPRIRHNPASPSYPTGGVFRLCGLCGLCSGKQRPWGGFFGENPHNPQNRQNRQPLRRKYRVRFVPNLLATVDEDLIHGEGIENVPVPASMILAFSSRANFYFREVQKRIGVYTGACGCLRVRRASTSLPLDLEWRYEEKRQATRTANHLAR